MPDRLADKPRHRSNIMPLVGITLISLASCGDPVPTSPREQLESDLRQGAKRAGYPWPERIIQMPAAEQALASSPTRPITPQQAWEAVVAYVQPIPERNRMPSLRFISADSRPLPCYLWGEYYYFPARSERSKTKAKLWGCFVHSRTGALIEYPGRDPRGHKRTSTYVQVLTCGPAPTR